MITDVNIREYLLGRLDSDPELVESIDEQTLTDPKFSISVDVVEDEIIEEYLEGSLSSDDRRAVERHFLRPPERQRKLETARLFSRYLEAESRTKQPVPAPSLFRALRIGQVLRSYRTLGEIAASIIFAVLTLNLWNQRLELDRVVKQINQQLGQERERSSFANQQLQNALHSLPPAIAMLNLVSPGLQRGGQELPAVKVSSGTRMLHVEVALLSRASEKYRVQLRHTGMAVWSQVGVEATSVPGGAILKMDIPADALFQGTGELAITFSGDRDISYWFSISKIQ